MSRRDRGGNCVPTPCKEQAVMQGKLSGESVTLAGAMVWLVLSSCHSACAAEDPAQPAVYNGRTAAQWLTELKRLRGSQSDMVAVVSPGDALIALGKDAIPALAQEVAEHDDADIVEILGRIGEPAVPALSQCLDDRTPEFRCLVLGALSRTKGKERAVPAIIQCLADTESIAEIGGEKVKPCNVAADLLQQIGAPPREALPALIEALGQTDHPLMQQAACEALGRLGPQARSAVPALAKATDPRVPKVAHSAIKALGSIGGEQAVAALAARFDTLPGNESPSGYDLQGEAARALGKTKDPSALPVLAGLLQRTKAGALVRVTDAFGNFGGEALDVLLPMLNTEEHGVRGRAARAIGTLGARAQRAVEPLRKALADPDRSFRCDVACGLGEIGPAAAPAVPDLIRDFDNGNGAISAVGRIGPAAKEAVPALIRVLADKNREWVDRELAADSLGKIGAGARSAIPVLEAVIKEHANPESALRQTAEKALGRIRRGTATTP